MRSFGAGRTASGLNKLFVARRSDGSCVFLRQISTVHLCALQHMKPKACKLWPFKVLGKPKYGNARKAAFHYDRNRFFVYADSHCSGLLYGPPAEGFGTEILKEFVEIALGKRTRQYKTTSNFGILRPYFTNGI